MAGLIHLIFQLLNSRVWRTFCDLHHHGSHGSADGLPDPLIAAFVADTLVIGVCSIGILVLCSPFLVIRARRVRNILWVIPGSNLGLYICGIGIRDYPGGFLARFQPPGLWYSLLEISLVLGLGALIAASTAAVWWLVRKVRATRQRDAEERSRSLTRPS